MRKKNQKKVVVVTGASAGVGRATVREFAKEGAAIALLSRNRERLEEAAAEVRSLGGTALVIPTDMSQYDQVEKAANLVEESLGPIDVWVNNAMVSIVSEFQDIEPEEYVQVTNVTYLGFVWGTRVALKKMLPRNTGTIVQVGSALAHRSIPLQSAYCGAKHAIQGFTDSIRCELIHHASNVHITLVHLPGVNTPQFKWVRNRFSHQPSPVGTCYQPEVAARAIVWASKHRRREVLLGFPTLESVFGNRLAPALLDRYLARMVYKNNFVDTVEPSNKDDNLFSTPDANYAAHGPYDQKARRWSWEFQISKHRNLLGGLALVFAVWRYGAWRMASQNKSLASETHF